MPKIVFTNGCFDIIHPGHVDLLERAAALGDRLIVGINSDASVRKLKGPSRPFNDQESRKRVLLSLKPVNEVLIFDESTPERMIEQICPDVLVKGGDWRPEEIVGAKFVVGRGGEVHSLPLYGDYSTTSVARKMNPGASADSMREGMKTPAHAIEEHIEIFGRLLSESSESIEECGDSIVRCLENGGKILLCGNGGSAADAQHIAAELIGRFEKERRGLPAIALTTDTSALTAIANDYDFTNIYSRQVDALAQPGDLVVCISTSGNSPNIIAAAMIARENGCTTVALTGAGGKKLASVCDHAVVVPSERTARIQEAHITIGHIWCEMVDRRFSEGK